MICPGALSAYVRHSHWLPFQPHTNKATQRAWLTKSDKAQPDSPSAQPPALIHPIQGNVLHFLRAVVVDGDKADDDDARTDVTWEFGGRRKMRALGPDDSISQVQGWI